MSAKDQILIILLIILINWDFSLTYLVLIFYLLFYIIISIGLFAILLLWKNKSRCIKVTDVDSINLPVLYCIFILLILAIAGFPIFILFFNKFYINCMLAQNNGLSIVILLIIITLLAAN